MLADADIDIKFHKWTFHGCDGDEAGDHDKIDDGHCESFDHEFRSFMVKPTWFNQALNFHNDYENPGCEVIVFDNVDCQGTAWSTGQIYPLLETCLDLPNEYGTGHSAAVLCNDGYIAVQGYVENGTFSWEGHD